MLSLTKILRDFQIPKSKEIFLKKLGKESQTTADEISACYYMRSRRRGHSLTEWEQT
jgi:hypothetical protein